MQTSGPGKRYKYSSETTDATDSAFSTNPPPQQNSFLTLLPSLLAANWLLTMIIIAATLLYVVPSRFFLLLVLFIAGITFVVGFLRTETGIKNNSIDKTPVWGWGLVMYIIVGTVATLAITDPRLLWLRVFPVAGLGAGIAMLLKHVGEKHLQIQCWSPDGWENAAHWSTIGFLTVTVAFLLTIPVPLPAIGITLLLLSMIQVVGLGVVAMKERSLSKVQLAVLGGTVVVAISLAGGLITQ